MGKGTATAPQHSAVFPDQQYFRLDTVSVLSALTGNSLTALGLAAAQKVLAWEDRTDGDYDDGYFTIDAEKFEPSVDIDVDSNNDGSIDSDNAGADDPIEETLPGLILAWNRNDDDANGQPDFLQDVVHNESDLREVKINIEVPESLRSSHKLRIVSNDTTIRVFASSEKSDLISLFPGTEWRLDGSDSPPSSVWVEGYEVGTAMLELQLLDPDGYAAYSDSVAITIIGTDETPVAHDDEYGLEYLTTVLDAAVNVLDNDYFYDSISSVVATLVTGPSHAASFVFNCDGTFSYEPTTGYYGDDEFTYYISDAYGTSNTAYVSLKVAAADIKVKKIKDDQNSDEFNETDDWLPEENESGEGKGLYIPVDDDDDDNDGKKDNAIVNNNALVPNVDFNDLVELNLTAGDAAKYRLSGKSTNLRVWKKVNNTFQELKTTEDLTWDKANVPSTLYLQGVVAGPTTLVLQSNDGVNAAYKDQDKISVKVFTVTGPRNVPDYSIYNYTASGVPGNGSQFVAPRFGTNAAPNGQIQSTRAVDSTTIFWNEAGPNFGKVRYQASADYTWAFDVAIVGVELDMTNTNLAVETNAANRPTQDPLPGRRGRIDSTTGRSGFPDTPNSQALPNGSEGLDNPAMSGRVAIDRIEGPTRTIGGVEKMYGVSFIEAGMIQTITFTSYSATTMEGDTYAFIDRSNMDFNGQTMLDLITLQATANSTYRNPAFTPVKNDTPWYWATEYNNQVTGLLKDLTNETHEDRTIGIRDTPSGNGVQSLNLSFPGQLGAGVVRKRINGLNFIWTFDVRMTVRTTDTNNDPSRLASMIYTRRALGRWTMDLSGTFDQNGVYTRTGAGLSVPQNFQEIRTGARDVYGTVKVQGKDRLVFNGQERKVVNDNLTNTLRGQQ